MLTPAIPLLLAAAAPPSALSCPVAEVSAPSGGDAFARRFGGSTAAYRSVAGNFAAASRRACASGLIGRDGLLGQKGGTVRLLNAPEANIASLSAASATDGASRVTLEYPFLASDGAARVPSADEIEEAIVCAVRGASAKEQEDSGRCLPD